MNHSHYLYLRNRISFQFFYFLLTLCLSLTLTSCSWMSPSQKNKTGHRIKLDLPEVPYKTIIEFKEQCPFEKEVTESSKLIKLQESPPSNTKTLYYRCKTDHKELLKTLKSFGYFDAKIKFKIKRKIKPIQVIVIITPGIRYTVGKINFKFEEKNQHVHFPHSKLIKVLKYEMSTPVHMENIINSISHLIVYFENHGFPYVKITPPVGQLNRESKEMDLFFTIDTGSYQVFGETRFPEFDFISNSYLKNRLSWTLGSPYDQRKVSKTRQILLESGIFSTVTIKPQQNGTQADMDLHVEKGLPRTIGIGIKYATTDGLGVKAYWSHRNFLNEGNVIDSSFNLSRRESFLKILYEKPDTFIKDLSFIGDIVGKHERTKAFQGVSASTSYGFRHSNEDFLSYSVKLETEFSRLKRDRDYEISRIFSVPFILTYDKVNNPVNPVKGFKVWGEIKPNFVNSYKYKNFTIVSVGGANYLRYNKSDNFVLATWCKAGLISQNKVQDIPLNKRFYGGGAGSVRAFGFQLLSPLDSEGKPIGGKSMVEFGIEPRVKITDKIGAVIFVEGGHVKAGGLEKSPILWGTGVGVRYYTDIGPLRLDVAIPSKVRKINGRKVDSQFQFYISFGQAF